MPDLRKLYVILLDDITLKSDAKDRPAFIGVIIVNPHPDGGSRHTSWPH